MESDVTTKAPLFITSAWAAGGEERFRTNVPLETLGRSIENAGGAKVSVAVLVIEGFPLFSPAFLEKLSSLGLTIIDYGKPFAEIASRFPRIGSRYSPYERNCFLRWLAFKNWLAEKNIGGQVWHIDSDMTFHAPLEQIAEDTRGKTFMTDGGPAFVSIANPDWFTIYERELESFEKDIDGYSAEAAREHAHCRENDYGLFNRSDYRNPLGSDQDLLEYLVSSRTLPQSQRTEIECLPFRFIENPMVMAGNIPPIRGDNRGGIISGGKRVPFIHYQGYFYDFAKIYLALDRLALTRLPGVRKLIIFKVGGVRYHVSRPTRFLWRAARLLGSKDLSKLETIERLYRDNGRMLMELLRFIQKTKQDSYEKK